MPTGTIIVRSKEVRMLVKERQEIQMITFSGPKDCRLITEIPHRNTYMTTIAKSGSWERGRHTRDSHHKDR